MTETERIRRLYDDRAATYDRSLGIAERIMLGRFRQAYGALLTRRDDRGRRRERAQYPVLLARGYAGRRRRSLARRCCDTPVSGHRSSASPSRSCRPTPKHSPSRMPAFDTVAISLALCTIPDPVKALLELGRVCRPGGRIVMLEHVRSTARPLAAMQRLLSPLNERAIGCHLDRDTFDLARSLGFSIDETRSRLFDAVRLVVARPPTSAVLPSSDPIDAGGVNE